MRERRWESQSTITFDEMAVLCSTLRGFGLEVKEIEKEVSCYFEEFWIDALEEIDRLEEWTVDEVTLVQVDSQWKGDFFVLSAHHYDLFRRYLSMEAYLSLCHPWQVPADLKAKLHHAEAMFWIGFRQDHGFIRVRLVPNEVITPGEKRGESKRFTWMSERAALFSSAIEALDLPLFVDWEKGALSISSEDPATPISCSWPDAFGPCQFEFITADPYELLVPAARLVSKFGARPATIRTFFSGFSREVLQMFHRLQPEGRLLYRGYVQAPLSDLPKIVQAVEPSGRVLANLCEFRTTQLLPKGEEAYAVIGVIGSGLGFKIEIRLNRAPLPEERMEEWLEGLTGLAMRYAPLSSY
ncbi:MAG: hypothetical protein HY282_11425 [Nitrospirae bacterium]|nr:hypothetical protein [Candidatus Manganitrophaceae bacterium]